MQTGADSSKTMIEWMKTNLDSKNITPILCSESEVPLDNEVAELIYTINVHHELLEPEKFLKESYRLLKESEQYTSSILSAIPDLIFVIDNNKNIVDFKSGEQKNLMLPVDEFINKNIADVLPQKVFSLVENSIDTVFENKKTNLIEYKLRIKANNTPTLYFRPSPI